MCSCQRCKGNYISSGVFSLVGEHGERTSTWPATQGILSGGDNAGQVCLAHPLEPSPPQPTPGAPSSAPLYSQPLVASQHHQGPQPSLYCQPLCPSRTTSIAPTARRWTCYEQQSKSLANGPHGPSLPLAPQPASMGWSRT